MFARRCGHLIIAPLILVILSLYFSIWPLAVIFFIIFMFFLMFFRDPERKVADGIVAAADGIIQKIEENNGILTITTFMNVHNVHVNRAPIAGKVKSVERIRGGYRPAFGEVSKENSRVVITLETEIGEVKITQIAGIFAWRIVPYITPGSVVKKGERIGIIRFGSKVVVELPSKKVKLVVAKGEKMLAGSSKIAEADVAEDCTTVEISRGKKHFWLLAAIVGFIGYVMGRGGHYLWGHFDVMHHWVPAVFIIAISPFVPRRWQLFVFSFGLGFLISDFEDFIHLNVWGVDVNDGFRFWGID